MDSKTSYERGERPPLPPRQSDNPGSTASELDEPPPYELVAHQRRAYEKAHSSANDPFASTGLGQNDPRSSSQQSLVPEPGEQQERRRLLLVYIHGFMGNETSFRSFPAHVHNLLGVLLAETHVVHTKIYPRYRSKGHISLARNDFSKWLEPHESFSTDVVLLGHSMGGLLSAEVALMPMPQPAARPLKHRILGTINFDVPFLGMHPGVVKSGLASMFNSPEEPEDQQHTMSGEGSNQDGENSTPNAPARVDTLWSPPQTDPKFNPSFNNDVVLPVRKGWRSAWHFINKHSDDLFSSTKKLVSSHMEFGGAMANYPELKARYGRLRALEEVDSRVRQSVVEGSVPPRVRFINYYTASTGRTKKAKSPQRGVSPGRHGSRSPSDSVSRTSLTSTQEGTSSSSSHLVVPNKQRGGQDREVEQLEDAMETLQVGGGSSQRSSAHEELISKSDSSTLPRAPPPLGDLSYIEDPDLRETIERQHEKATKKYEEQIQAIEQGRKELTSHDSLQKSLQRTTSPKPRAKPTTKQKPEAELTHSEREELRLERERRRLEAEARRMRGEKEPELQSRLEAHDEHAHDEHARPSMSTDSRTQSTTASTLEPTASRADSTLEQQDSRADSSSKPKKDRKFCNLPPKDSQGQIDPCWVRVFMQNVDEVGAHCGLFFVDERYERLVGDVAERIEGWVNDEAGQLGARGGSLKG